MRFKNLDYKTMPRLMTHLVANFPDPKGYQEALKTMLEFGVDYLEIQLPFNHPVGDGKSPNSARTCSEFSPIKI
jgi:tryptophan synthase alpha subunit